ncbi:unnamed protein product [Caenorhabditis auriculariae]|uniref:Uncharacterized protein n=1 Tax=Caenorhabditis auriculariae TaxID=2777116 RepID=A0A8S1HDT0_9PELO|nr:unnamed protein product [Caenorhabditis auriculariae]
MRRRIKPSVIRFARGNQTTDMRLAGDWSLLDGKPRKSTRGRKMRLACCWCGAYVFFFSSSPFPGHLGFLRSWSMRGRPTADVCPAASPWSDLRLRHAIVAWQPIRPETVSLLLASTRNEFLIQGPYRFFFLDIKKKKFLHQRMQKPHGLTCLEKSFSYDFSF